MASRFAGWRRAVLLAACSSAGLSAIPAQAQDATAQNEQTTQPRRPGDAIIVTAERRATNLQDTPLSIVAVTEETIQAKGIEDLEDLSRFTPNLNITPSRGGGSATPNFSIRGVSGGGGATGERGVGLYIDGIYVPRTSGSVLRVLDIDRIEVLRGPQGTLFGRNSTGGAIRIFTRQPELDIVEGYVRVTAGNLDRRDIVGAINFPAGEDFALRLQGAYLNQGGYVERGTQDLGGQRDYIVRGTGRYDPDGGFEASFGVLYSDTRATRTPMVFEEFDMRPGIEGVLEGNFADWLNDAFKQDGQAPLAPYNDPRIVRGAFTAPSLCFLDDFDPDFDEACEQNENNDYFQADLRLNYEISDTVEISSVSGYSDLTHVAAVDYQVLGTEDRSTDVGSTVFYQELQLNAALFDGALDFVTGLNYFYEKATGTGLTINRRGTSVFPNQPNGNTDAGLFYLTDSVTRQDSNSYGVFASGTWHIAPWVDFTGGLRFAYDEKDYWETEYESDNFTPAPGTNSTSVYSSDNWDQIDWRATIDFDITPDWMIYATASKAYKAGQYSFSILDRVPGADQSGDFIQTIPPEKVQNYEAGMRLTALDGRIRFNPTGFFMQWTNRQAARQVACVQGPTCPIGFEIQVVNSGDVDVYGVELDAGVSITDSFWIDASGAWTEYELKDPVANSGPNLYPDVPEWTFNIGANYAVTVPFGEFTFNASYAYTDEQATHPTSVGDSAYTLPAIELVNARIRFEPANAPVSVSLFANNLFDNTYATYAQRFGGGYWDQGGPPARLHPLAQPERSALSVVRGRPREVGVTLQYDF